MCWYAVKISEDNLANQAIKGLWTYIKKNNLQDPKERQYFTPDAKVAKVSVLLVREPYTSIIPNRLILAAARAMKAYFQAIWPVLG